MQVCAKMSEWAEMSLNLGAESRRAEQSLAEGLN